MIAVKLEGRLGNQLFQYAFIYATAKKLNTTFYIDKRVDHLLIDKYFNIKNNGVDFFDKYLFSIKGFKNIFSYHLRYKFYHALSYLFKLKPKYIDNTTEPSVHISTLTNNTFYTGFFQSEQYFAPYQKEILKLFTLKNVFVSQFKNVLKSNSIPGEYVAVHIRRGDYVECNLALSYKYFHDAIAAIHNENNFYIFISDEPNSVAAEFKNIKSKYISCNDAIIDFQFIANANTCIISNSSFSWWGAYLNNNDPKIIAPKYWFGTTEQIENPRGILPKNFIGFKPL